MTATEYHHLLVISDWEITVNELFLEESGPEDMLRKLVADESDPLRLGTERTQILEESEDLDDLREFLEERGFSIYIQTIDAPEGVASTTPQKGLTP